MSAFVDVAVGTQFGSWTTTGPRQGSDRKLVPVRCVCGYAGLAYVADLRSGKSRSCRRCGDFTYGRHGDWGTRLYHTWKDMKRRCSAPAAKDYVRYGARGISVCADWMQYIPFRDWAHANGYSNELTIERKNPDGNYEPSNCEWITKAENSRRARRGPLPGQAA